VLSTPPRGSGAADRSVRVVMVLHSGLALGRCNGVSGSGFWI
jgi:hypothetical protein